MQQARSGGIPISYHPDVQAARGRMTVLLDGDNIRHGLNKNLGFRWGGRARQQLLLVRASMSP